MISFLITIVFIYCYAVSGINEIRAANDAAHAKIDELENRSIKAISF